MPAETLQRRLRLGAAALARTPSGSGLVLETLRPGARVAGLKIRFGFAPTPLGQWLAAESDRGVCRLAFVVEEDRNAAQKILERDWPGAVFEQDDTVASRWARTVFEPGAPAPATGLRGFVKGTDFQARVWETLLRIPAGALATYGAVAAAAGHPKAVRAAGTAIGLNPLAGLIPCHRVVQASGALGGYRWGPERKRLLIARETSTLRG